MSGTPNIPFPRNEPVLDYAPGAPERAALVAALDRLHDHERPDIPAVVGGREVRSGEVQPVVSPQEHAHVLATAHQATRETVTAAIDAALAAQRDWAAMRFEDRAAVFLRAAELLATTWRPRINAATMLGQSKTAHQAEIDAACELIDFLRYNVHFAERLMQEQPVAAPGIWNRVDYRPLEGFVYAVTPFNFTAIAGNLPTAPAILGNVVLWKPTQTALLSNWWVFKLLEAAGLPPGVINFVPGDPAMVSEVALAHPMFAGLHFTGSTAVFRMLWRTIGERLDGYRSFPRIVGETGGKDFVVAHASADVDVLATALVRGAFEYQGQKCSAASRAYIPDTLWPRVRERVLAMLGDVRVGDVRDFRNFMGAVIDRRAFDRVTGAIARARGEPGVQVVAGGTSDASRGFFIDPTVLQVDDPAHWLMQQEFFGPLLAVHVYSEARWTETLALVDGTSPYGLTGAVLATDRAAIAQAGAALRHAAGNFYINDKPTGAVVGQQPFGGGRASGTNDKAGAILNLQRWVSPRAIKETLAPPTDWRYPYLRDE